jgi:hypothetical protein
MAETSRELMGLLTRALEDAEANGLPKTEILPAITDWAVEIGMMLGGEEAVMAMTDRMKARIEEWRTTPIDSERERGVVR